MSPSAGKKIGRYDIASPIGAGGTASALNHPNIIVIHEIGESEGIHFIATEYIEGETLRDMIRALKDRHEYEKFFTFWNEADADMPTLLAAREEFRVLT